MVVVYRWGRDLCHRATVPPKYERTNAKVAEDAKANDEMANF